MIRTDRTTGEPILSPKLTADQLHAMANDPGWRPWMRLIAEHPHAWPALVDWWRTAQRQGFDEAGAAPRPPESMRRRRRVAIPSAPLPPEHEPGRESVPASMDGTPTAGPEPSQSQSSVSGSSHGPETEQSHPDDSTEKALRDADGDFAALEQVADLEPTTMSLPPISEPEPTETGKTGRPGGLSAAVTYSADPDDLKVRRVFPVGKALVAIVMAASLIAVSWMGLQIKNRHAAAMWQEAHETAISACDSAEATRKSVQSDLDRTTAKASKLLKDTSRGQVADPKTLDALNRLLGAKTTTISGSCASDAATSDVDRTTEALRGTTKELKNRLTDLKTATKAVTDSKLDRTVDDADALYKEADGRVADGKTRETLLKAVKTRDADAIAKAVKEVNESKAAKEKADAEAKAKAEQEAAAAAAAQQAQASQSQSAPQRQTPSYSGGSQSQSQGSSGSGSGTGRRPSSGGSSSSTNTGGASPGWSVPAPSDEGTGLPGSDPGL
ncbi:molecular chaperone [Bifidobacterium dentium]|uniref:molecular chaperone n=1 Tax=Bifidobacterium dentium TaxID=1689 RepID=UPI002006AE00|nr:molecular chaperone [Bifidobacterium dentium]MCK6131767.1 molecular chaperone [Bifidobacterium dentium]